MLHDEMLLLTDLLAIESDDSQCWDLRARLLFYILIKAISVGSNNVLVCNTVILTCLGIIEKYTTYYERSQVTLYFTYKLTSIIERFGRRKDDKRSIQTR